MQVNNPATINIEILWPKMAAYAKYSLLRYALALSRREKVGRIHMTL